jgi:uncharacterized membrane protein YuzA (DUF378 family)
VRAARAALVRDAVTRADAESRFVNPVPPPESERDETPFERADRNLAELLNELRVALPGVQVLFAFLLIVPFSQGYAHMSQFERKLYFGVLLCTGLAAMLLIAPSMHHRLEFRRRDKEYLVLTANRLTIAGLSALAVAMTGAILLITHVLFGTAATIVTSSLFAVGFAVVWYLIPLRRLAAIRRERTSRD